MILVSDDLVPFEFSRKLTALQRSLYAYILTLFCQTGRMPKMFCRTRILFYAGRQASMTPKVIFKAGPFRSRYQVMAHITKSKRSRLQFSNEIIEALAAEELDTKRIALNQKALQLCYDLLPDHMKRIARLRFREDSQLKDIAKKVGRPLGSVSATLHRIRINLMDCA